MRATLAILLILAAGGAPAQTGVEERRQVWESIGGWTVDLGLAGPAGGGVVDVQFSADGSRLFTLTGRGEAWETADLGDTWTRAETGALGRTRSVAPAPAPTGEPQAAVYGNPFDSRYVFALGKHLYRSSNQGRSWVNLSADGAGSVIGDGQRAIAFSPADPELIIVANGRGLWRSVDAGLSWSALNQRLPNLPAARMLSAAIAAGPQVFLEGVGPAEAGAQGEWRPAGARLLENWLRERASLPEADQRRSSVWPLETPLGIAVSYRVWRGGRAVSPDLTDCGAGGCLEPDRHYISAFGWGGEGQSIWYAGASDGRLWVSTDGAAWRAASFGFTSTGSPVTGIFVDRRDPRVAIAVSGGRGHGHVFRTTNAGIFWDDLSANLPDAPVHAVAANPETGSIYVASEAGVFYTRGDLRNPSPATRWSRLGGNLPRGAVEDLRLDMQTGSLYVAVAGYGVYRAPVPDIADVLRVLNAADLSARAAAPGGLLTVIGAPVRTARAAQHAAPVLAAGPSESQIQVPFEVTGTRLELELETQRGSARLGLALEEVSPAIFVDRDGTPLALDAAGGQMLDSHRAARAGSQILVLATGLGRVRPDWPTGLAAPVENPPATIASVSAWLDGAPLKVISSTLAGGYIGVYMVRIELPGVLNSGTGELSIAAGDKVSNRVRIFLEP